MKLKSAAVFMLSLFLLSACAVSQKNAEEQNRKDVYSVPDGTVLKVKLADNELKLVVANSPIAKSNGLSNKKHIPEDGMIFFFYELNTLSFWMKDMHFPIDIIWLSGNKVIGIEKSAPAPEPGTKIMDLKIYKSNDKADTVIELEAGACDKLKITPGSILEITDIKLK
jgi:uncharacterized membrane protein (UPF0127 family)